MRAYLRANAFKAVTTADFEKAMARASGRDLTTFFRQWVYRAGFPAFRVSAVYDSLAGTVTWSAKEVQPMDSLTGTFDVDADVVAWTDSAGPPTRGVLRIRGDTGALVMRVPSAPVGLRFDDGGWIPCVADFPRSAAMLAFQLRHDPDVLGRIEAVDVLSERRDEPAVLTVLAEAARRDGNWGVRQRAVAALGTMADDSAAAAALLEATRDRDARVRQGAAAALRAAKAARAAVVARLEDLQVDTSVDVRSAALGSLTALDSAAGWRAAREALGVTTWLDGERANAVVALHSIPGDSAWVLTARYLGPDASRYAREAAIRSLMARVRSAAEAARLAGELAPVLDADAASVRTLAAQALGALGQSASIAPLNARRAVETDDGVRAAIDAALATIGGGRGP
jgi:aminopeptidase N